MRLRSAVGRCLGCSTVARQGVPYMYLVLYGAACGELGPNPQNQFPESGHLAGSRWIVRDVEPHPSIQWRRIQETSRNGLVPATVFTGKPSRRVSKSQWFTESNCLVQEEYGIFQA